MLYINHVSQHINTPPYNKESYHDIYYDVLEHNIDEKVTWAKNKEMSPWAKVYLGKCLLGQQSLGLKSY